MSTRRLIFAFAAALIALSLIPALHAPLATAAVFMFFSCVCHQDPARSFWISGTPVAVCARCLGIYLGAVLGAWVRIRRRTAIAALLSTCVANGLDVLSEIAGQHGNWALVRFTGGIILGVTVAAVIANGAPRGRYISCGSDESYSAL